MNQTKAKQLPLAPNTDLFEKQQPRFDAQPLEA
jgi:hypothetical protein